MMLAARPSAASEPAPAETSSPAAEGADSLPESPAPTAGEGSDQWAVDGGGVTDAQLGLSVGSDVEMVGPKGTLTGVMLGYDATTIQLRRADGRSFDIPRAEVDRVRLLCAAASSPAPKTEMPAAGVDAELDAKGRRQVGGGTALLLIGLTGVMTGVALGATVPEDADLAPRLVPPLMIGSLLMLSGGILLPVGVENRRRAAHAPTLSLAPAVRHEPRRGESMVGLQMRARF